MNRLKKFLYNATLLTLTSLVIRGVSLGFNAWLSGKIGAEALGLFSLISGVYNFALTLATSGISLAATRMVAEALGQNDISLVRASMKRCILYALFFGALSSVLLFSMSNAIGTLWLRDTRTILPLRMMSVSLPLVALSSAMNGYFTAVRRVSKNALSQISEQAVKISLTVLLLLFFLNDGIEQACIALVLGGAASEILSFLIMLTMYLLDKRKHIKATKDITDGSAVTKKLLGIALPVAFSAYVRSGLLSLEHSLIPAGLRKSGASHKKALAAYGTLGSMALPVVLFPSALIASFANMTIPEISDCLAKGHKNRIKYISGRVWQFSLMFSIGVSGILICFSGELGNVLYSSEDAGIYIKLLAPLVPVMYLDSTTDAILKGLGEQLYSMNVNIIDSFISVIAVYLTVPILGINGYIFVIITMEVLNFALSATRMLNISEMRPKLFSWIAKPLICIIISTCAIKYIFGTFAFVLTDAIELIICITLSAAIYLLMLCILGAVNKDDRKWISSVFKNATRENTQNI